MSTIEVRGSRQGTQPESMSRQTFEFEDAQKKSRLPLAIGMALTALAAYFKSALPIFGLGEDGERPQAREPATADPVPQGQVGEPLADETAEKEEPQNTFHLLQPFPEVGLNLRPIVDYRFRPAVIEDSFAFPKPFSPVDIPGPQRNRGGPANDNSPASPGTSSGDSPPVVRETDVPGEDPDEDDQETPDPGPGRKNRGPVVSGGVRLNDVMAGQMVLIGLSELLANMTDPDGDALSVRNVRVSAGSIGQSAEGWVYSSNRQILDQDVTVTYDVTDGEATITRTALLRIEGKAPIIGTEGDDLLAGLDTADQIDAGDGDDIIDAKGGDDYIRGGAGNDHIMGGAGNDHIEAGAGNDVVFAGAGNDVVRGGSGNDRLFGEAGDDLLYGDDGDDDIDGGDGNDIIDGGAGHDRLSGGQGDDVIKGGAGNDSIFGGDGHDIIEDGPGADTVHAGAGNDVMLVVPDLDADSYDGGDGVDTIDISATSEDMRVDFSTGVISGPGPVSDAMSNIEVMILGAGSDTVIDGSGSQSVTLGAGNDVLVAAVDGVDDCFIGGDGRDTLDLSSTTQGVTVNVTAGTAVGTEIGSDSATGFEVVMGGSGDDCLVVDTNATTDAIVLVGGKGNDAFHFQVSNGPAASNVALIHQILDFMVGDQVFVADYEFRKIRGHDGAEKFERIYQTGGAGLDDDEFIVRLRDATTGNVQYAVIEVDRNKDDTFEFSIEIYSTPSSGQDPISV
jgi:Ca2+-binding RTX toxin-like protein